MNLPRRGGVLVGGRPARAGCRGPLPACPRVGVATEFPRVRSRAASWQSLPLGRAVSARWRCWLVTLDPLHQYGRPVVRAVPTEVVAEQFRAGKSTINDR